MKEYEQSYTITLAEETRQSGVFLTELYDLYVKPYTESTEEEFNKLMLNFIFNISTKNETDCNIGILEIACGVLKYYISKNGWKNEYCITAFVYYIDNCLKSKNQGKPFYNTFDYSIDKKS